ncbi:MAG: hypothetical protein ACRCZF_05295, partial [Gemmataceae bacterium]
MADAAPKLPSTPPASDGTTYAPYAVLAIAAMAVTAFFVLLMTILALMAVISKQRFFEPMLLALPAVGLVLAYAGRRQVINSEGARDGLRLCTIAWWCAILGGCGYGAYLFAVQFSIQNDAIRGFNDWAKNLKEVDSFDQKNIAVYRLFIGASMPDQQPNYKTNDVDTMWKVQKSQALGIRQSDIVQLGNRNRESLQVIPGGLENWEQTPIGLNCRTTARFICDEGEFEARFGLVNKVVDSQPRWQVIVNPSGNITSARVTPYGQTIRETQIAGYELAYQGFLVNFMSRADNVSLLEEFSQPGPTLRPNRARIESRMALGGGLMLMLPEPADYSDRINKFFVPGDQGDPAREGEQRRAFQQVWRAGRMVPAKRIIAMSSEGDPQMKPSNDRLELRVPIEIQTPSQEGSMTASRGYVLLRLDDPAYLAKLNTQRAEARKAIQDNKL